MRLPAPVPRASFNSPERVWTPRFLKRGVQETKDHIGASQGGMAAQIHFRGGREPAQVIGAGSGLHEESRLGQVVFRRDALHQAVIQTGIQRHHSGGIFPQHIVGERIDLPQLELHHGLLLQESLAAWRAPGSRAIA